MKNVMRGLMFLVLSALIFPIHGQLSEQQLNALKEYAQPGENHKLLESMYGKWEAVTTMWNDKGEFSEKVESKSNSSWILDGRFLYTKYQAKNFTGMGLHGYNNSTKKFVWMWIDSMATGIYMSEGEYDATAKTFTFVGKGFDPLVGKDRTFKNVIHIESDVRHTFTMYKIDGDKQVKVLHIAYQRPSMKEHFLKSFDYYAGTWQGQGEFVGMGKFTDSYKCEKVLGDKFLKCYYQAKAGGKIVWQDATVWGWDEENKKPFSISFGFDGSVSRSTKIYHKSDKVVIVEGVSTGAQIKEWRTITEFHDENHYSLTVETKKNGKYVTFLKSSYCKKK